MITNLRLKLYVLCCDRIQLTEDTHFITVLLYWFSGAECRQCVNIIRSLVIAGYILCSTAPKIFVAQKNIYYDLQRQIGAKLIIEKRFSVAAEQPRPPSYLRLCQEAGGGKSCQSSADLTIAIARARPPPSSPDCGRGNWISIF